MLTGSHELNIELLSDQLSVSTNLNLQLGRGVRGTGALERGCPPFVLAALAQFLGPANPSLSTDAASAWPLILPPYYPQETLCRRIFSVACFYPLTGPMQLLNRSCSDIGAPRYNRRCIVPPRSFGTAHNSYLESEYVVENAGYPALTNA